MQNNLKISPNSSVLLYLLALFALPLIINPVISLNFNDVFLNIKAVWILAVVLPAAAFLAYQQRGKVDRRVVWLFAFWLGWIVLAGILNSRGWLTLTGAPNRLQGLPIYLTYGLVALAAYLWSRREAKAGEQFVKALSGLTVPLGVYVALQYYGIAGIISGNATGGVSATLAGATLGNRGYLAGCVALLLPLTATFASRSRLGLLCVFLAGFSLTASLTRGALLAAAIGYICWIIQGNAKRFQIHTALVLGLLTPLPHLTAAQLGTRSFGSGAGQQQLNDDSARAPLWNTALYGIKLRPLFGWGTGQLLNVMARRPDSQLLSELKIQAAGLTVVRLPRVSGGPLRWRATRESFKPTLISQPVDAIHNEYLEYAFTFGIPAAMTFIFLYLLGFFRAWKRLPWAAASLAAYLVYLLTWPETIRFASLAWAILGFALAAARPSPPPPTPAS